MFRPSPRLLPLLCLAGALCAPQPALAQERPADAAEISRDLLYHPVHRIELGQGGVLFRAAQFTYRFDTASGQWQVVREKNFNPAEAAPELKSYKDARSNTEYSFTGLATEEEGILEIRRAAEPGAEPLARLRLWTRQRLAQAWIDHMQRGSPDLTLERLLRDLEPAEPEVAGVADDGTYLWLAIRHYTGEGWLGIGTVVRFDPQTNEARIFQPFDLATSSVTHIALTNGNLWLGTHRRGEGTIEATAGLVRFNPKKEETHSYVLNSGRLLGRIVTVLLADKNDLWVATDAGVCRVAHPAAASEEWTCWRIVPTVRLAAPVSVSNRPGGRARGQLPAGDYEVRWALAGFVEVVTPDAMEGWIETDDLVEHASRKFDTEAYELANTYGGGASVMRLLEKVDGDRLAAAQAYRAALEKVGEPTEEGWQRVRARVAWIARAALEVTPAIQPAAK